MDSIHPTLHPQVAIRAFQKIPTGCFTDDDTNIFSKLRFANPEEMDGNIASSYFILAINLDLIVNFFHLQNGIYRAYFQQEHTVMKTKYLITEIFYHLANTGKFTEAINQFSINTQSHSVALVFLPTSSNIPNELQAEDIKLKSEYETLCRELQQASEEFPPEQISQLIETQAAKQDLLKKAFKLSPKEMNSLESSIMTKLAVKDLLN
jgi:hypothetical protein